MPSPKEKVGLCLSGGGFRATLFHLGVVRELWSIGALDSVTHICSVSGGSILAAHLVQHWQSYVSDYGKFDRIATELLRFVAKDVRGKVLRAMPYALLTRRTTSDLLVRHYDRLYAGALMAGLPASPKLELIATCLGIPNTPCSFSQSELTLWSDPPQRINSGTTPISVAVAASSAFPAFFSPVFVDNELLGALKAKMGGIAAHYLSDGGILDNSGARIMAGLAKVNHFDVVIISDAGAALDWDVTKNFGSPVNWFPRVTGIMSDRISTLERQAAIDSLARRGISVIPIAMHDTVTDVDALNADTQNAVRAVRTDVDAFTEDEIRSLVWHGQAAARSALKGQASFVPSEFAYWDPLRGVDRATRPPEQKSYALRKSHLRQSRLLALDCLTIANALVVIALGLLVVLGAQWAYHRFDKRTELANVSSNPVFRAFPKTSSQLDDLLSTPRAFYVHRSNQVVITANSDDYLNVAQTVTGVLTNMYDVEVPLKFKFSAREPAELERVYFEREGEAIEYGRKQLAQLKMATHAGSTESEWELADERIARLRPREYLRTRIDWKFTRRLHDEEEILTSIPIVESYILNVEVKSDAKLRIAVVVDKFVPDEMLMHKGGGLYSIVGPVFSRQGFTLAWGPRVFRAAKIFEQ